MLTFRKRFKPRSFIWLHSRLIDNDAFLKCNYCLTKYVWCGSPSNMIRHLDKVHQVKDDENDVIDENESQQTKKLKHDSVDQLLLRCIVKCSLPFRIVQNGSFRDLINKLDKSYKIPNRERLSNALLDAEYNQVIKSIQNQLAKSDSVAITTDIWTSCQQYPYLGVTIHYFNEDLEFCSSSISLKHLPGIHSTENISECLLSIVTNLNIVNKLIGLVLDNSSNCTGVGENLSAKLNYFISQNSSVPLVNQIQLIQIGCNAHILNLIVNKLESLHTKNGISNDDLSLDEEEEAYLKRYAVLLSKCRQIVTLYDQSTRFREILKERQNDLNINQHGLIQDVSHRWNSSFLMLQRINEQTEVKIYNTCIYNQVNKLIKKIFHRRLMIL